MRSRIRVERWLRALASRHAWEILIALRARNEPAKWSALRGKMSKSVLHTRLTEFEQQGLVRRDRSSGYQLTEKGDALLESLSSFEAWAAENAGMSAEDFLDRAQQIAQRLFPKLPADRTADGVTMDLGAARLAVVCRGDDSVEVYLQTSDNSVQRSWRDCSDPAARELKAGYRKVRVGHRADLGFEWFLEEDDYSHLLENVRKALHWLAQQVLATSLVDHDGPMEKAMFLRWVEKLLAQYKPYRIVDQSGTDRHYRRIRLARGLYLAIDAKESKTVDSIIRVHLLSPNEKVTQYWRAGMPSLPLAADSIGVPIHREGARRGRQQYFGYELKNEPVEYRRALPRVKACADYLSKLVETEVALPPELRHGSENG